ncbi:MAG: nucleoside phosphorylase [Anaerolineae bacterium]|nr:nucleoside phosphorylase [Anaerolineae bacterium]
MAVNEHYELAGHKQYHIQCGPGDIGKYVLLPGDPGRISLIASLLDDVREVAYNREHRTITGTYKGITVSATSTGMGCPSTAIAVEELIKAGAKVLVRVGSTAGIADRVSDGDYILPTGAVPLEGASPIYLDNDPFAHVPDFEVLRTLHDVASETGKRVHTGVVLVHDAFYAETDAFLERWHSRNVVSVEMESSILFLIGTLRKVRTAAFHLAGGNLMTKSRANWTPAELEAARATQHRVVLEAFKRLDDMGIV